MKTLSSYLQKWKLKFSVNKTVTAAFHLYNIFVAEDRDAWRLQLELLPPRPSKDKRVQKIDWLIEGRALSFSTTPTYLGVKLDRALTFRQYLESLRKKLTTRVGLLRRLAGSSWGAGAIALRTTTLALVHSTAEYYAPVWCRSAHTRLIDRPIYDALHMQLAEWLVHWAPKLAWRVRCSTRSSPWCMYFTTTKILSCNWVAWKKK